MRVREIREMSPERREERLTELRAELLRLRAMVRAGGAIENPMRVREIKKAIARILTVQNEKQARV
ncbi:MAG: 50S ribosomal protein L29 [Candidatus Bathyarchaeia archaeon]